MAEKKKAQTAGEINDLERFNPVATCPKCGCGDIRAEFKEAAEGRGDTIGRTCSRCGFGWKEKPLDA